MTCNSPNIPGTTKKLSAMSDYDFPSFEDPYRRWSTPESTISLTSILLTTIVGACVLFKALELSGFPVWFWFDCIAHMSFGLLQLRGAPAQQSETDPSDETPQGAGGMLSRLDGVFRRGFRGITGALSSPPSNAPPGLGNISNSCYQNSVIQGFAALPSLREYLSHITTEHPTFSSNTTNGALHDLITRLNDPDNQGRYFWVPGRLKSMSTFTQQDAQEYYSKILDELDMEVRKASSSKRRSSVSLLEATRGLSDLPLAAGDEEVTDNDDATQAAAEQPNIMSNPLDGLLAQRVGCTSCGYSEGLSMIPFNCMTVSLGSDNFYDIRDCLDEYTKLEYIDGVECAKCTLLRLQKTLTPLVTANPGSPFEKRLNAVLEIMDDEKFEDNTLVKTLNIPKKNWTQSSKSKQIVVARAPKSLVLHVNRSIFDENTGAQYKNTAGVSYPRTLDLGDWCLGSSPSGSRRPDMSQEEWPRDPKQSMLFGNQEGNIDSPFQYRLRAVVTHAGTHGSGHYVCYRPHATVAAESEEGEQDQGKPQGEQWWRFSDDSVYAVSEAQAHQANVFMLFYERLDGATSSTLREAEPIREAFPVPDDAPLPPEDIRQLTNYSIDSEFAVGLPLPDDDEEFDDIFFEGDDTNPRSSSFLPHADDAEFDEKHSNLTPPPETTIAESAQETPVESINDDTETEMSEAESEDAPSTQFTSDSEAELASPPTLKPFMPLPPHMMRTAGNAAARGQGGRQSLPMVSAT
ncbi:cysteine proteinase [Ophiobolus disseminans]|uniref:ubiquitinyl hydrolase 1 n=1 Tax=Ophiobolus disseminans TaxID=1469910 RepID=A0A6A6ZXH6_9PLEO|nr:cysteine proteinase [Ophiobolus disseminans]